MGAGLTVAWAQDDVEQATVEELVDLVAQRLLVGEAVAAAKYGNPRPIDDPAREAVVLAGAMERARALRVDRVITRRFVAAQIEASKIVQRGWFARWRAGCGPTMRPDLARDVRPVLDEIDERLITVLGRLRPVLGTPGDAALIRRARMRAEQRLDALHRRALARALSPVCPR